jgi:hypothetical protein
MASPGEHGDEPRLVVFLDAGPRIDLARLHADCVGALPGLRTAVAPRHYVVCAGSPTVPDLVGWRQQPVLVQGSGRCTGSAL